MRNDRIAHDRGSNHDQSAYQIHAFEGCYYLVHIHNPTSALHFIDTIYCSDVPCGNLWHVTCQSDNDSGLL